MANYFRRLISNQDMREAVALALIGIVLLILAYFVTVFAIRHMPAPFGSFEELMKP
jgi:drug/metabolite transporter (DMT)-like permease